MAERVERAGLSVDGILARFIEDEALPGTGIGAAAFWPALAALLSEHSARNAALLDTREVLQSRIDGWYMHSRPRVPGPAEQAEFLGGIGYLQPEGEDFGIETGPTDPEIATIAGPQLVVPVTNARFALNAANARWGSLYDALYGTDALGEAPAGGGYDPARGARVVAWAKEFLDEVVPLSGASWAGVTGLSVDGGLTLATADGPVRLADPSLFAGHVPGGDGPAEVILRHHGLHIRIRRDPSTQVGGADPAGISDVILESAVSTIMDCEDSVACVDGADKAGAYRNWLGLMTGTLEAPVEKGGQSITRRMADDIEYVAADGTPARLKGRSLMLVRNVGHLMRTPAVRLADGAEAFEGLLDAMVTVLIGLHDRRAGVPGNSAHGAIYVVKPKMHGPDEVAFASEVFGAVEQALGLEPNTVRLGLMDEERRTSVNLKECIRAARHRLCFINTGFLDRTGDEIHTAMEAGPMIRKGEMKTAPWLQAYEDRNVDIGLACGLRGRAQIGKGMWAAPERMGEMLRTKIAHPRAGANTAWVPSPTAATLHATHYHRVDVAARQSEIAAAGRPARMDDLLTVPVAARGGWSRSEIRAELENNAQGILGYVVRWVDQGVGCSKVPDIHDVALMEDRATCRISSQHIANWLYHEVVSPDQVMAALRRMAGVVDRQNAGDPAYRPMAPGFDGHAFQAACDLVFRGREQPSGYTEPALHRRRAQAKAARAG